MNPSDLSPGTLNLGEAHPSAYDASRWIRSQDTLFLLSAREALASCSLSGNRLAEVCSETLRRFQVGDPVSDRYLLGLAWHLRGLREELAPTRERPAPMRGRRKSPKKASNG